MPNPQSTVQTPQFDLVLDGEHLTIGPSSRSPTPIPAR